jgi:hypothetical protein
MRSQARKLANDAPPVESSDAARAPAPPAVVRRAQGGAARDTATFEQALELIAASVRVDELATARALAARFGVDGADALARLRAATGPALEHAREAGRRRAELCARSGAAPGWWAGEDDGPEALRLRGAVAPPALALRFGDALSPLERPRARRGAAVQATSRPQLAARVARDAAVAGPAAARAAAGAARRALALGHAPPRRRARHQPAFVAGRGRQPSLRFAHERKCSVWTSHLPDNDLRK